MIVGLWADSALRWCGTYSGVLNPPEGSQAVNRGQCPWQTRNSAPLQPADLSSGEQGPRLWGREMKRGVSHCRLLPGPPRQTRLESRIPPTSPTGCLGLRCVQGAEPGFTGSRHDCSPLHEKQADLRRDQN